MNLPFLSKESSVGADKSVVNDFASKNDLVYLGFVDQNTDDAKIIRGFSVSDKHRDNHYSVGTVNEYNVAVVERNGNSWQPDGKSLEACWMIMTFELHTQYRIPHFFVGANNHDLRSYAPLFSSFPNMLKVTPGTFEKYADDFNTRFTIFARPAKAAEVELFLNAEITRVIAAHFWPLSIEQHDNVLYVYSDNQKVTTGLLNTMLENGLWLAGQLDKQAESVAAKAVED